MGIIILFINEFIIQVNLFCEFPNRHNKGKDVLAYYKEIIKDRKKGFLKLQTLKHVSSVVIR